MSHRSSKYIKVCIITICLLIASGAYISHSFESLWPAVPVVALVAGLFILSLILYCDRDPTRAAPILVLILSLAVFVRLYPALSAPTLPGNDPHKYAVAVHSVLETGSLDRISLLFYRSVPAFVTLASVFSTVVGVSAWGGLTVYPLFIGVLLPLLAFILVRRLERGGSTAALLAALLAAVTVEGVRYATQPNANMFAIVLFGALVYVASRYVRYRENRYLAIVICIATALLYTHKLAPVMVIGFVIATAVALRLQAMRSGTPANIGRASATLLGLSIIGGLIQWTFMTEYVAATALRLLSVGSTEIVSRPPPDAAISVSDTVWSTIHRRIHMLVLLPVGGIAWLYAVYSQRDTAGTIVIAATAAIGALMPLAIIDSGVINPIRVYLSLELLLAVLVCLGIGALRTRGGSSRHLAVILFVGLLTVQAGSAFFVADTPSENREYLTEQEVEGKAFAQATTGDIGSDWFYSDQVANLEQAERERSWQPVHSELFEGEPEDIETDYIAYRTDAEPYRIYRPWTGRWMMTYDAEGELDANRSRIYANDQVRYYTQR